MTLLDRVTACLVRAGVGHALIGAAALAAHGIARSTYDIDLLATDARVLEAGFWDDLRREDIGIDVRCGDSEDPLRGVVRLDAPSQRPVDVIVGRHAWQARAVARAEHPAGGPPVVTALDLVLLKLYAGGTQDLWDVRELLRVPGTEALATLVTSELQALPRDMQHRWRELQDAG